MTLDKFEAAQRLIKAATGNEYGDGSIVTDVGVGYASSEYGDTETVWVLGNWNNRTVWNESAWKHEPRNGLTEKQATIPSRLFDALERIGVSGEWCDEWNNCHVCYRLMRTQPDSYSWQPDYIYSNYDGLICGDCARTDIENSLDEGNFVWEVTDGDIYTPESNSAVTFCEPSDLLELGFEKHNGAYENGWHPGQDDSPDDIAKAIAQKHKNCEIVFFLDENSQFYVRFSAYVRINESGSND